MIKKNSSSELTNINRLLELDALRGIAAIFVLLFHYAMPFPDKGIYQFFKYGISGVDLFFLISGFVIFMSVNKVKNGAVFLINRFCRLFPTYWAAITFTFIVILFNDYYINESKAVINWENYLYNLTMFQYYFEIPDLDGPYWTMIIEMIFYLVLFLLIIFKSVNSTIPLFVSLTLFSVLVSEYYKGWGGEFYSDYFINFPLTQFVPLFLAGILFYQLKYSTTNKFLTITMILCCYFAQILLYKSGGRSSGYITHSAYKVMVGLYFLLLFLFVYGKLKWIVNDVTLYLGKISFALYLIHQYVSINCIIPFLLRKEVNYYIAAYLIALPVCILVASLITFYIEKPVGSWMKNKLLSVLNSYIMRYFRHKPELKK